MARVDADRQAASTATHCAVFAQLIIKGKKHGVKTFIVQLRDTKWVRFLECHDCLIWLLTLLPVRRTFRLLPGIMIGDIGKKMGRDGIDNGYIQVNETVSVRSIW